MTDQRIIWLASYPKSGNTWVRAFLANYFIGGKNGLSINELRKFTLSDIRADFYHRAAGGAYPAEASFDEYLMIRQRALRMIAMAREGNHFVKTHHRIDRVGQVPLIPPQFTAAAVYVLRNPFDVAPSLARHNGVEIDEAIAAMADPALVQRSPIGVYEVLGRWDDHVSSWVDAQGLPQILLKYEDLSRDAKAGFSPLFDFLKVEPDPPQLRRALKATRFDSLKKQEATEGFRERPAHMQSFFHSGKAGGWRDALTAPQVEKIIEHFASAMERWYPVELESARNFVGKAGA